MLSSSGGFECFLPVEDVVNSLCSSFVLGMAAASEKYRDILSFE